MDVSIEFKPFKLLPSFRIRVGDDPRFTKRTKPVTHVIPVIEANREFEKAVNGFAGLVKKILNNQDNYHDVGTDYAVKRYEFKMKTAQEELEKCGTMRDCRLAFGGIIEAID